MGVIFLFRSNKRLFYMERENGNSFADECIVAIHVNMGRPFGQPMT
jgi:hypothetical protein